MRTAIGLAAATILLAGCQSEEAAKQTVRNEVVSECSTQMAAQTANVPGLNVQRFCDCLANRTIESRGASELRDLDRNSAAAQQAGQQAAAVCMNEQMSAITGAGQSQARNAAADAGEEAADEAN